MSNRKERGKMSFKRLLNEHPTITILGILGVWSTILISGFTLWFHGAVASRDGIINYLREKLADCQQDMEPLKSERDSLRRIVGFKQDQYVLAPTVFCSKRSEPILNGEIVIALDGIAIFQDIAAFTISNIITKEKQKFRAPENHCLEFEHRDQTYVIYFLGFEKKEKEDCAKISVRKKQ